MKNLKNLNYIAFSFCLALSTGLAAQEAVDSSTLIMIDTLNETSTKLDSTSRDSLIESVQFSKDSLNGEIIYGARDTQWVDLKLNQVHLFGDAYVEYQQYSIKAGYIIFDFENDLAYAEGITTKRVENSEEGDVESEEEKMIQKPQFSDGRQTFTYNKLKYNFKTKKGIVYDAVTEHEDLFLHGTKTKFVSADSLHEEDHIYNKDALITTCDHETPHYGIRTRKLKVIPDRLAVVGPANLEIAGVPTPLFLPFGFFPLSSGRSAGLIFPDDYEYSQELGFGLREFGYYFPLSDYMDLKLTGDIYTRGTWALRSEMNYNKRYAFNGIIRLGYSDRKSENSLDGSISSKKAFSIQVNHNQSAKAHPYRKIQGSIRMQSNDYQSDNYRDVGSQFTNIYNSNFYYNHSLPGTPFSLRAGMKHDQNTQTGVVNLTLPDVIVNMNTIYPFKRKKATGGERWYEEFSLKYDGSFKNYVKTQDSILFTSELLEDLNYGFSHKASTGASFRVLDYFNFTPNARYEELWFFRFNEKVLSGEARLDSTLVDIDDEGNEIYDYFEVFDTDDITRNGFKPYRRYDIGANLSTQLFGTKTFGSGWLRGLRHVIKPTVGFTFSPDTKVQYQEVLDINPDPLVTELEEYSPFIGGPFGTPSLRDRQAAITYSLVNIFEGKYFSKSDSTEKKFKLFDNITMSGRYNFAADSLNWSKLNMRGNARFFGGLTTFSFSATFDPYLKNEDFKQINQSVWNQKKRPFDFESLMGNLSTNFTFKDVRDLFRKEADPKDEKKLLAGEQPLLDILDNFNIRHNLGFRMSKNPTRESFEVATHTLAMNGRVKLTDNWNINVQNISYDFKNKTFVYPAFTFSRNLHCWKMDLSWYPALNTYSFFIGIKSNSLNFVKYNYGKNRYDGRGF